MLNDGPRVGHPSMPRRRGLVADLRAIDLRSRRARVVVRILLVLAAWYALTSIGFRDGIRGAVLAQEIPDANDRASVCYIAVEGDRDPSDRLLARFSGGLVPARKASATPPLLGAEHVVPGLLGSDQHGHILSVESVRLVLPFLAIVETTGYQAGLAAHGDRHIVLGLGPVWKAVSTEPMWVS
jgi:hypothetical protein